MVKGSVKKSRKTHRLPPVRCTEYEYNRVKILANAYAKGNFSRWQLHGALEAPRKKLD